MLLGLLPDRFGVCLGFQERLLDRLHICDGHDRQRDAAGRIPGAHQAGNLPDQQPYAGSRRQDRRGIGQDLPRGGRNGACVHHGRRNIPVGSPENHKVEGGSGGSGGEYRRDLPLCPFAGHAEIHPAPEDKRPRPQQE